MALAAAGTVVVCSVRRPLSSSNSTLTSLFNSFPPEVEPISNQNLSAEHSKNKHHHHCHFQLPIIKTSRRDAAAASLLLFLAAIFPSAPPAAAFSIGISGPKDWLKEQKKKSAKFLLAPIDASREILRSAYLFLTSEASDYTSKELEEVQRMLRSAARDCVPQERSSFVAFQANTGVEVCTFRLIVKNASSLLDKNEPAKLEAEAMLDDLVRAFTFLNSLANDRDMQLASNRQKVAEALMDTLTFLDKFEESVKGCLEV